MGMGEDTREVFDMMREHDRKRRQANLNRADPTGWKIHTDYHWSRTLAGSRLDYWPSRNRFMWRGRVMTGDVDGFIRNREREKENG